MTVTKDQAQMLASLAVACRPHRAPTWDEAGVIANIGKVKERDLSLVVLAVIRAASDRECNSPGVIPSNGPHWSEQLKAPKWEPTVVPAEERCSVCARDRARCASTPRFADDDHTFVPDFKQKRSEDAITQIVAEVRTAVAHAPEVADPKTLDDLLPVERNPRVMAVREQMTTDHNPTTHPDERHADV